MRRSSFASMNCSIAQTLEIVGDPWTLLIVRDAFFGLRRFDEFRRSLGIPRATLSARLTTLVEHDVLAVRDYEDHPPRHEYVLTTKGRSLGPVLVSMLQWGDEWAGLREPPVRLFDADTDEPVRLAYVDERTGRPLADMRLDRRRT